MTCTNCGLSYTERSDHVQVQLLHAEQNDAGNWHLYADCKGFCSLPCLAIWADMQQAELEASR